MELPLNSAWRKRLLIGVTAVLCLAYVVLAGRFLLGSIFADQAEQASLERATRLDPWNAEYRNRLGRYYSMAALDPAAAIKPFRAAVELNPFSARYWFQLASAYQVLGDSSQQSLALEQAIHADPTTPDVAWEAANFYVVQGENEKALREFRVVLQNEPTLADPAIQLCWRLKPDVDVLLRDVVPQQSDAQIAFLSLLMRKEDTSGTAKVWSAMMANPQPFELRYVKAYLTFLLNHKDVDQARLVWQQAAPRFGLSAYLPSNRNLIVNGDFNLDVLNGGFDWQYEKQQSVTLTLDPSDFHSGHRSLMITFDGPGINDAGIRQFIAVQPNTSYDFSAYYKNGEMEGAGGPHFTIQDAYDRTIFYDSDELKEAGFWKSATGSFTTGADTKLLVLHVRRLPEGSPIRGKIWVDDFRLTVKRPQP